MAGLVRLPWFEHARRDPATAPAISDCRNCLATQSKEARQSLACHYEPTNPAIPVRPWDHSGRTPMKNETPMCAGYVCSLPQVIEAARAHTHWSKGSLSDFCGARPNERVLESVEILEGSIGALKSWVMSEANKK